MPVTALKASLILWRKRADYRKNKWKASHKTHDKAATSKWWHLWQDALKNVELRTKQINAARPHFIVGVSDDLVVGIQKWEGGSEFGHDGLFHPYWDADGGVWTIGYGHIEGVHRNSKPLTEPEAHALLRHDLNVKYAPAVTKALKSFGWAGVSQKAYDGLVSFCYNLGPGYFQRGHNVGDAMAKHSLREVADAILLYDKAGGNTLLGLTRRRRWESGLVKGGSYAVTN